MESSNQDLTNYHAQTRTHNFHLTMGVKVLLYNGNKEIIDEAILSTTTGNYGVQMPANVWHIVECLEAHTVLFEVKEGLKVAYIPYTMDKIERACKNFSKERGVYARTRNAIF